MKINLITNMQKMTADFKTENKEKSSKLVAQSSKTLTPKSQAKS
jgi:hypothetical protein